MFAPLVTFLKAYLGQKEFLKIRGKAIALHSQVITAACETLGIDRTYRQSLIRVARDNGKAMGLLA